MSNWEADGCEEEGTRGVEEVAASGGDEEEILAF